MKRNPTKTEIERHDWWWRKPQPGLTIDSRGRMTAKGGDPNGQVWKDGAEGAVFRYELVRRLVPSLPKLRELSNDQAMALRSHFTERTTVDVSSEPSGDAVIAIRQSDGTLKVCSKVLDLGHCVIYAPHSAPRFGFSDTIQFNLQATDSALQKRFFQFIAEQRKAKRIKPGKLPRKNAISWRWLEVWDMNERDGVPLNRSAHSMKTKARKMATAIKPEMMAFLESIKVQKSLPVKPA